MDREEIRYLLGSTIYARAKAYENRVQDLECETAENGVRHLSADVRGSGRNLYRTQAWLRQNGSFVSASCTCPFNENGEGPCCKHIGALLLHEVDEPEEKTESKPEKKALLDIPGVQRGTEFAKEAAARKDSYVSGLEMLFGRKWRGDEPVSDVQAQELLRAYQEDALAEVESLTASDGQQRGFAELEPELILDYSGQPPLLRLRISDGGRQYVVKSIPGTADGHRERAERQLRQNTGLCPPLGRLYLRGTENSDAAPPPAGHGKERGSRHRPPDPQHRKWPRWKCAAVG